MGCTTEECFIDRAPTLAADKPVALFEQLRHVVQRCVTHGHCFFIIEDDHVHRYVQGLVTTNGLVIESVSNTSLGPDCVAEHGLTQRELDLLLRLGWSPPDDHRPNWYRRIDVRLHDPAALVAEILVRTLTEVHRATPRNLVLILGHAVGGPERVPVAGSGA